MNKHDNGGDVINHPFHYTQTTRETIDVIKDVTDEGFHYYCVGTILKYLGRYRYKNGIEDLKKARWYLDKLINELEG
ncbi:MAG: hypothetical protein CBC24_09415 [Candidatus Pelagibacter sp. TMED64]|nr:MAG: hypothetical protein CBC24_09415 [Candidatus Pelagibacter sp. TMED64]|tara:strand:- start:58 stop:288 length:231 start_codon:yes stop_codon:yes gene_type:complete